jgi:hypothetical protein
LLVCKRDLDWGCEEHLSQWVDKSDHHVWGLAVLEGHLFEVVNRVFRPASLLTAVNVELHLLKYRRLWVFSRGVAQRHF